MEIEYQKNTKQADEYLKKIGATGRVLSNDWAHHSERSKFFNGVKIVDNVKLKKGDVILAENVPTYKAKKWLDKGIIILTCHTMSSHDHRAALGIERKTFYNNDGHAEDAMVIYDLFQTNPNLFYKWKHNIFREYASDYKAIQGLRISVQNRMWSYNGAPSQPNTIEHLKKAEKELLTHMSKMSKQDFIFNYLLSIPGIGPSIATRIRSLDVTKFNTASKLRKYCGLAVVDGEPQKRKKGESSGYNATMKATLVHDFGEQINIRRNKSPYLADLTREKDRLNAMPPSQIPIEEKDRIIGDILAEDIPSAHLSKGTTITKDKYPKLKKALKQQSKASVLIKLSDGHIHNRAIRKVANLFLEDYWVIGRQYEGFPTVAPYSVTIQNHPHYRQPPIIPSVLQPFKPEREVGWIFKEGIRPWSEASSYIRHICKQDIE